MGIDFGTSTTVVSIATIKPEGRINCETILLKQKMVDGAMMESEYIPSIIAKTNQGLLVGQGAFALKWNPDYVFGHDIWHSFKMELGKDLGPQWFESRQSQIKSPQEATKVFFKYLKKVIEDYVHNNDLSTDIRYAVSIPASFESNQRKDLLEALAENDFNICGENLIDEPNAAFLGYINKDYYSKEPIVIANDYNSKVLVFDFGAGTCDISILELTADYNGLSTRNISISQFTELGGNDIDRYIATNYLLPNILKINGRDKEPYTDLQQEVIVNQLMGVAEKLKIQMSKNFDYLISDEAMLKTLCNNNEGIEITIPTNIYTDYGDLNQSVFKLSYQHFIDTMKAFYSRKGFSWSNLFKMRKRQGTIETVIESAIGKAKIRKSEIDYVMMVGGSSRNPFIQKEIKEAFGNRTRILIPQNMQSLVSQGAALHSLLVHGLGITAIKPITSEPIVIVVKDEQEIPIIPAGTQIPFSPVTFSQITTGDKEKSLIEIPVCVSSAKKLLCNVKIASPNGDYFPLNTPISLIFEMSADKVLSVKAKCQDSFYEATCENPFANAYLTDEDRKILSAQRASNISANRNGGKPTREALHNLRQAYLDADKSYQAAETIVDEIRYYQDEHLYNYIGVLYSNSGNISKAIYYFEKAVASNPNNAYAWSNLGDDLRLTGDYEGAKAALEQSIEIKADYAIPRITLGRILNNEGNKEEAQKVWTQAYNILKQKWDAGGMDECSCGWFISVAESTGHLDIAQEVKSNRPQKAKSNLYNRDNLATFNQTEE